MTKNVFSNLNISLKHTLLIFLKVFIYTKSIYTWKKKRFFLYCSSHRMIMFNRLRSIFKLSATHELCFYRSLSMNDKRYNIFFFFLSFVQKWLYNFVVSTTSCLRYVVINFCMFRFNSSGLLGSKYKYTVDFTYIILINNYASIVNHQPIEFFTKCWNL